MGGMPEGSIAIVAVHGVGNCDRGQTARDVATLLQQLPAGEAGPRYGAFAEEQMHLPVSPIRDAVHLQPAAAAASAAPAPTPPPGGPTLSAQLGSQSSFMRSAGGTPQADPGLAFSLHCISEYTREDDAPDYATPVFRGTRTDATGAQRRADVFEMYWSDLSSLQGTVPALLGGLYQLLLHVGSLARTTADMLYMQHGTTHPALGVVRSGVGAYVWLFTVLLVALNLAMLVLGLGVAPRAFWAAAPEWSCWLALAVAALLAGWLLRIYDRRRPGVFRVGVVALVASVLAALHVADQGTATTRAPDAAEALVGAMGALFIALPAVGAVLAILFVVVEGAGLAARRSAVPEVRASLYTIRIGLLVPAGLFCVVTVLLWAGVHQALLAGLPPGEIPYEDFFGARCPRSPVCTALAMQGWHDVTPSALADKMMQDAGSPYLDIFLAGLGAAFVLLLVGIVPAARKESRAPRPPQSEDTARSVRTGRWVDALFASFGPWAFGLFGVTLGLAFGLLTFDAFGWPLCSDDVGPALRDACRHLRGNHLGRMIGGSLLTGAALFLVVLRFLQSGARAALDIALDVDRWLQERPLAQNPRARMFSRYHALLDHVLHAGYDRIVIVAHSQGSVITADLLRLLVARGRVDWPRALAGVRVLTVGNPLGQLYARRFPLQYAWCRAASAPALLGVHTWLNLYRSGDYVGRQVWGAAASTAAYAPLDPQPASVAAFAAQRHAEHCIGDGAHTHYFDGTALVVGEVIDRLAT